MKLLNKLVLIFMLLLSITLSYACDKNNNGSIVYDYDNHDNDYHWNGFDYNSKQPHDYITIVIDNSTCTTNGIIQYRCRYCSHQYNEEIALLEHKVDSTYYIDEVNNTHYQLCSTCGSRVNEELHDYSSYTYDENSHQTVCACGKTSESTSHVFTQSTLSEPDGNGNPGIILFSCVCGYTREQSFDTYATKVSELITNISKLNNNSSKDTIVGLVENYNNLPTYYQNLVTNYESLKKLYDNILTKLNSNIKQINDLIDSITDINDSVGDVITKVDNLYNNLEPEYQELITNYDLYLSIKDSYNEYKNYDYNSNAAFTKALYNTAMNYYYQKTSIQYDQYNSKRNMLAEFNDATTEKLIYLDCSSFINSVYYMCFGNDLLPSTFTFKSLTNTSTYRVTIADSSDISTVNINYYALSAYQKGSDDLIYFIDCNDSSWTSKTDNDKVNYIKNTIIPSLQVGDIITYRYYSSSSPTESQKAYGSSGHIMMYIGNNKFIHCTGTCVNFTEGTTDPTTMTSESQTTTEKNSGAISIDDVSLWYTSTSKRYLGSSTMSSFSVLRPVKSSQMTSLTTTGKSMVWNKCLDVEKTVDAGIYRSVAAGSNLTYTIKVNNSSSSKINYIFVKEQLPTNTTFESASDNGYYDETTGNICWKIASIDAGRIINLTYTVKASSTSGLQIESYHTYVNNIRVNMLVNTIVKQEVLTNLKNNLLNSIKKLSTNNYDSFHQAYQAIFAEMGYNNVLENVETDRYMITNTLAYYVLNTEAVLYNQVPGTLYGGNQVRAANPTNNNLMRIMYPSFLECGDIIVTHTTYNTETFDAYLYVDTSHIYKLTNNLLTLCYDTTLEVTEFVHTLPFYKRFVVIRPTLSL